MVEWFTDCRQRYRQERNRRHGAVSGRSGIRFYKRFFVLLRSGEKYLQIGFFSKPINNNNDEYFERPQAGLVGLQVLWTKDAEIAIRKARIDKFIMKVTNQRFLDLLNNLIDLTSKDLTVMDRIRYETMVTIHVHQR